MRHRREFTGFPIASAPAPVAINPHTQSDLLYLPLQSLSELSSYSSSNVSIESINPINGVSHIRLSNGFIDFGSIALGFEWTIEGWFNLSSITAALWSIGPTFSVSYNRSNLQFEVQRRIYGSTFETKVIPFSGMQSGWHHLAFCRLNDRLKVFVDLVPASDVEFNYPVLSGSFRLGQNSITGTRLSAALSGFRINTTALYPSATSRNLVLDALKPAQSPQVNHDRSDYKRIHLTSIDAGGSAILPYSSSTRHDATQGCWVVSPSSGVLDWRIDDKGLTLVPVSDDLLGPTYTIEGQFKIPTNSSDITLWSSWESPNNRLYYLQYEAATQQLSLNYTTTGALVTRLVLGTATRTDWDTIAIQGLETITELYLNGKKVHTLPFLLKQPYGLRYRFNVSADAATTIGTLFYLRSFSVLSCARFAQDYVPYTLSSNILRSPLSCALVRYHAISSQSQLPIETVDFDLVGSSQLAPGTTSIYTVQQKGFHREPVSYTVSIEFPAKDELTALDFQVDPFTIVGTDVMSAQINLLLKLFTVNPFKRAFKLVVSNRWFRRSIEVSVVDARPYSISIVTGIQGYLDGYLSRTGTAGSMSNLTSTRTASTIAARVATDLYGAAYRLQSPLDRIALSSSLTGVRTIVMLYRELSLTANRQYVGHSTEYTFNGGPQGELIGDLITQSASYIPGLAVSGRFSICKISGNNSTIVLVDDNINAVLVYSRNSSGIWDTSPITLPLDPIDAAALQGASISLNQTGTFFALGLKNGNTGEGLVQVWKKTSSGWIKDLHLGCPVPDPYRGGFGYQVALSDSGTTLIASEVGSGNVYVFEKSTLWNASPVHTFTGTGRFGFSIALNAAGTLLAVSAVDLNLTYFYTKSSSWDSAAETIPFAGVVSLHPSDPTCLISNLTAHSAKLFKKQPTWTSVASFNSSFPLFASASALDTNSNVYLSSPDEQTIYKYPSASNWMSPETLPGGGSDVGYSISANPVSVIHSNYVDLATLVTYDQTAIPSQMARIRQNGQTVTASTQLAVDDVSLLVFQSTIPLDVDQIGAGNTTAGLDGLFLGALFYDRLLSTTQLGTIETFLRKYLTLHSYGSY